MYRIAHHAARWAAAAVLCAGLSLTLPAVAQSGSGQQGQSAQSNSQKQMGQKSMDPNQRAMDFFNTLNQGEIQTAKTMQSKAQNAQVRDYAKMIQDDHQKAQDQLKDVASKANAQLGTNSHMEAEQKELDSRLQNATGKAADSDYLRAEARDHMRAIRRARALEKQVTDPGLKDYIATLIPELQKHQRQAHSLGASLGGRPAATPAGKAPQQSPQQNPPRR